MKLTLAEVLEAKDLELGTSGWFRIDQQRIDRFAETTDSAAPIGKAAAA